MASLLQILSLSLMDALGRSDLKRTPEPTSDMSSEENVSAFHQQGTHAGALLGVYQFNALAIHALTPSSARVLDLGCGSGQCLAHLARCRPDLQIVGIDLSESMIRVGRQMLAQQELGNRVQLRVGDMTQLEGFLSEPVDIITSIFSLHHLKSTQDLTRCIEQVNQIQHRHGSAVWIFDHARPRRRRTVARFPRVFTPKAPDSFNEDSSNSLSASWSFSELGIALSGVQPQSWRHCLARILPLYQIHWCVGGGSSADHRFWYPTTVTRKADAEAQALKSLFKRLP